MAPPHGKIPSKCLSTHPQLSVGRASICKTNVPRFYAPQPLLDPEKCTVDGKYSRRKGCREFKWPLHSYFPTSECFLAKPLN